MPNTFRIYGTNIIVNTGKYVLMQSETYWLENILYGFINLTINKYNNIFNMFTNSYFVYSFLLCIILLPLII